MLMVVALTLASAGEECEGNWSFLSVILGKRSQKRLFRVTLGESSGHR